MREERSKITAEHVRQAREIGFVMMTKEGDKYPLAGVPADMVQKYLAWGYKRVEPE